jgi:cytochrome c-type biogenesis protein CcmE
VTDTIDETAADAGIGPIVSRRRRPRQRLRLTIVFAILAAALVFVLAEGLGSSLNYFDTVDQALAHRATLGTSSFRLEGVVVPGTVKRTSVGADFSVSEGDHQVPVQNSGSPPELFQPDIPVVVVGHFASGGSIVFMSDQIMVKHSANYIAAHPSRVRAPNGTIR